MKNIKIPIGVFIAISFVFVCYAIAKTWQSYGLLAEVPADGDHLMINDVSDPTDNAAGTVKRLAWSYVQNRDADLTSIAALSTTAYGRALLESAQPDDGEIIIGDTGNGTPVWANITETGDALTISNGAGTINFVPQANLEAIADAETGVTDPCVSFYDINAAGQAGSDKLVAKVCGQWKSGAEAAQIADLEFYAATTTSPGAPTLVGRFDSANDIWDLDYPVTAPSINAGISRITSGTDLNLQTGYLSVNKALVFQSSTSTARNFTLWSDPYESTFGSVKEVKFYNNDVDSDDGGPDTAVVMYLVPEALNDIIIIAGTDECTTSEKMSIASQSSALLTGLSATAWLAECHGTCACVAE